MPPALEVLPYRSVPWGVRLGGADDSSATIVFEIWVAVRWTHLQLSWSEVPQILGSISRLRAPYYAALTNPMPSEMTAIARTTAPT